MVVPIVLRLEQIIGLRDRDGEGQNVSSGARGFGGNVVLGQPFGDGGCRRFDWTDEGLKLYIRK